MVVMQGDFNSVEIVLSDKKMLECLVCPISHSVLQYDEKNSELISQNAKLAFPIRDGIPVLIISEARKLE
jgi:uncharacterized protein